MLGLLEEGLVECFSAKGIDDLCIGEVSAGVVFSVDLEGDIGAADGGVGRGVDMDIDFRFLVVSYEEGSGELFMADFYEDLVVS